MSRYRVLCLVGILASVLCGGASATVVSGSYSFIPSPSDLDDLTHGTHYKWGLNWQIPEGSEITGAYLTIANLNNWQVEPNILYIHLLDDARLGVKKRQ